MHTGVGARVSSNLIAVSAYPSFPQPSETNHLIICRSPGAPDLLFIVAETPLEFFVLITTPSSLITSINQTTSLESSTISPHNSTAVAVIIVSPKQSSKMSFLEVAPAKISTVTTAGASFHL